MTAQKQTQQTGKAGTPRVASNEARVRRIAELITISSSRSPRELGIIEKRRFLGELLEANSSPKGRHCAEDVLACMESVARFILDWCNGFSTYGEFSSRLDIRLASLGNGGDNASPWKLLERVPEPARFPEGPRKVLLPVKHMADAVFLSESRGGPALTEEEKLNVFQTLFETLSKTHGREAVLRAMGNAVESVLRRCMLNGSIFVPIEDFKAALEKEVEAAERKAFQFSFSSKALLQERVPEVKAIARALGKRPDAVQLMVSRVSRLLCAPPSEILLELERMAFPEQFKKPRRLP